MRYVFAVSALGFAALASPAFAGVTGYYRFPTIRADRIVFAAEGDLWQVGTSGGTATRLTSHEGSESFPHLSPDGSSIAFSGEYQGNVDVYVMPAGGGEPRRLTFAPEDEQVVGWRPDGSGVLYRRRGGYPDREFFLYEVAPTGGQPHAIPIGPVGQIAFAPDGKTLAFNRWALEDRTWKRYRGGEADDVWVGDLASQSFRKVTDWKGPDSFPMWRAGRVYFLSDRTGVENLFSMRPDGSDVQQHTRHTDHDARWPAIDGDRIVYMHGGDLWLFDAKSGDDRKLEIELASDRVRQRVHFADASDTLDHYALDREGKRLTISSRGELWVAPVKKGRIIQLTRSSGVREREPQFAPDGKSVAAITDESGEQEIALFDCGSREHRLLTKDGKGWIQPPEWSPDGKLLAYSDLAMTLHLVDVASGVLKTVDRSTAAEITDYTFSPDGQWLAYTARDADGRGAIHLFHPGDGKSVCVSTPFSNDWNPSWDPDGKYLFFLSTRTFNPVLGDTDLTAIVTRSTKPCALILASDGRSPFLADELLEEPAAAAAAKKESAPDKADEKPKAPVVKVDADGIEQRVVEFPLPPDAYGELRAVSGKVFYAAGPTEGLLDMVLFGGDETPKATLHCYDLKKRKDEVFVDKLRDYALSGDGKRIAWRVHEKILVADAGSKPAADPDEGLDPSELPLAVDPPAEWAQIFAEAWRLQRDFYWAENMAGIDWRAAYEKYRALLPRIGTRAELNDLIGQLIGELATSHTYVFGGDVPHARQVPIGRLGADIELDSGSRQFRFQRICRAEAWETDAVSPLAMSHANVHEGDYLFGVNGRALGPQDSVDEQLADLAGQQVLLRVGSKSDQSDARDVQVEALRSDGLLRYRDWCRRNREYVESRSGGKIGYFHLPDMMGAGLREFHKGFFPQIHKDAILIDARYNGGGFVSPLIIEALSRKTWAYMKPRRGATETFPARVHDGYKAVLINQHAGSDGDIFPETFQMKKLGPVIGMRTWGGVVGLNSIKSAIDGGITTQPTAAWWEPARGWSLENTGVIPDIEVDYRPDDYLAGRDPQIDRAVTELLQMLEQHPLSKPSEPPVPNKTATMTGPGG